MDFRKPLSPRRLSECLRDGTFGLPDFQRPSVWSPKKQIDLLTSLCDGLPIGVLTVTQVAGKGSSAKQRSFFPNVPAKRFRYVVLDGQQRLRAISAMCEELDPYDAKQHTLVVNPDGEIVPRRLPADKDLTGYIPVRSVFQSSFPRRLTLTAGQRRTFTILRRALTEESVHVVVAYLRSHSQAVELFERINSKGSRLAMKDLVAARLAEAFSGYIVECDRVSRVLAKHESSRQLGCFDRMVLTKSVSFAATGRKTASANRTLAIISEKSRSTKASKGRRLAVRSYLEASRKAGLRLRDELENVFGLAGKKLNGVLDGNAALVAMQFFITHKRPKTKELQLFRRWLFTMLFSTYYTGGATEKKVDDDLAIISKPRVDWKTLLAHASEALSKRNVVISSTVKALQLNKNPAAYSSRKQRVYFETLRRISIANQTLLGWLDKANTTRLGDPRATIQHIFPRRPRGKGKSKLGRNLVHHPANFATIEKNDNSKINNRDPWEYMDQVSHDARSQQQIPPRKLWAQQMGEQFLAARLQLVLQAVERKVNSGNW